jgi:hypothetical protein
MVRRMMFLAGSLLGTMTPPQLSRAHLPFDHPSRLDWDFVPKPGRTGLPLSDMTSHQRTLAHTLLQVGLSERGYSQALSIMAMENVLRERGAPVMGVNAGDARDPDKYFFAFYGQPAFEDTWAWRILGHHLSISFTIIEQRLLTVTPCNMGAEPASSGVLAPLAVEEGTAFSLLGSLDESQRRRAVIHDVAPADFVTRQVPLIGRIERPDYYDLGIPSYTIGERDREALAFRADEPAGLCASELSGEQANQLRDLVGHHVGRAAAELANPQLDRVDRDGAEHLYFAWAGGLHPGTSHYFRIQGSHLLIEFDNAIDSGNHIHSVWRDYRNDLGHDLLLEHYVREAADGSHLRNRLESSEPWPDDAGATNPAARPPLSSAPAPHPPTDRTEHPQR